MLNAYSSTSTRKNIVQSFLTEGPLFYLSLSTYVLRKVITNPYLLNQKFDWSIPWYDLKPLANLSLYSWNSETNGAAVSYYSAWIGDLIYGLTGYLCIKPIIFIPLLLVIILSLAGFGMHRLLRHIHVPWPLAMIASVFYVLSPTVYIRIVVGFTLWLLAYALAPWIVLLFLKTLHAKKWLTLSLWTGILLGIATAQIQFSVMISFLLVILIFSRGYGIFFYRRLIRWMVVIFTAIIWQLPWLLAIFVRNLNQDVSFLASSSAVLRSTIDLPHSLLRTIFLNEHHITYGFFDQQNNNPFYFYSGLVFISLLTIGTIGLWKKISLRWLIITSGLLGSLITLLPQEHLVWLYEKIFNATSLTNLFREVYHAQFLMNFAYSLSIGSISAAIWFILTRPKERFALIAVFVIFVGLFDHVMIKGNFQEFAASEKINPQYQNLYQDLKKDPQISRIWYPKGLGFVRNKKDQFGASNGDVFARSQNKPSVDQSSSVLNLPSNVASVRNTMIHTWQQGENVDYYLEKLAVNYVIDRTDYESLNVFINDEDKEIKKYWQTRDLAQALDPNQWRFDANLTPINIYRKTSEVNKIYPAFNPVLSAGFLTRLNQESDVIFLDQLAEKEHLINSLNLDDKLTEYQLILSLTNPANITTLATETNKNYQAKQGWSNGRYSWWYDLDFASRIQPFVFTRIPDSLKKNLTEAKSGFYNIKFELWHSPKGGIITIGMGDKSTQIDTKSAISEWRWHDLPEVVFSDFDKNVEVNAISGEQAVGSIVYLRAEEWETAQQKAAKLIEEKKGLDKEYPAQVSSEKVNPTKYQLTISNQKPFLLVFAESFDSHWQLQIGQKTYSSIPVNGWANGFWIEENLINQNGQIIYLPQQAYNIGLIIVLILFIFTLTLTVWQKQKSSRF